MGNLVKYGSYTEEAAAHEKELLDKQGGGSFFNPEQGDNVIRFVPPPVGRNTPYAMVHQHFIKIPGAQSPASFNCPRMMAQRACPACQMADKLYKSGNPVDKENSKEYKAKLRVYAPIIDRQHPEKGVQIYAFGKQVHDQLITIRNDGDYTHPIEGYDIVVNRTGKGKDTSYQVRAARKNSQLADTADQMNEWIELQPDVTKYSKVPSDDDIRSALNMPSGSGSTPGGVGSTTMTRRQVSRTAQDDADDVVDMPED